MYVCSTIVKLIIIVMQDKEIYMIFRTKLKFRFDLK